jgi:hypothetical protein
LSNLNGGLSSAAAAGLHQQGGQHPLPVPRDRIAPPDSSDPQAVLAAVTAVRQAILQPARRFSAIWRLTRDHLQEAAIAAFVRAELAALARDAEASAVEDLARAARAALDALDTPAPVEPPPVRDADADADLVRLDPELGRLAVGLGLAAELRVWAIARQRSTTQHDGCGWVVVRELRAALDRARPYTDRHLRRLLRGGHGLFWQYSRHRVYLAGVQKLAAALAWQAAVMCPTLVSTNIPGRLKDVYLPVTGTHEQWEATLYAGWLAAKDDPTIARATLEQLFNRTAATLLRWEQARLAGVVVVTPGFAQVAAADTLDPDTGDQRIPVPAGARTYEDQRGTLYLRWQMPNTYWSHIRQHPHKGQGRKVRQAVASSLASEPLEVMAEGQPRNTRRYYEDVKRLKAAIRRHGPAVRYLFVDRDRRGRNCWEPRVDHPYPRTRAGPRWVAV